jgi:hypothetical protein
MYENRSHCLGSYHEILSARYEEMSRELAKLVEQPDLELTRHERGLLFTVPPPPRLCLFRATCCGWTQRCASSSAQLLLRQLQQLQ